jgi:hypothetical protein
VSAPDHRDLVIEQLADDLLATEAELVEARSDAAAYRELAQAALSHVAVLTAQVARAKLRIVQLLETRQEAAA